MQELMVRPTVYRFQQCVEFAGQFQIGKGDLILTNEFIYQPFFASLNLDCDVIYQERYGAGEPTDVMAEAIAGDMNPQCRRIIAIGGGTILDIAKILALDTILPIEELYDGKRPITRSRELILVPTTCGTGSEMTNIAILALTRRNTKKGLAHDSMYADAAVLIPELLKHLPFRFFATSSIDALIHAMESSLSPRSNETHDPERIPGDCRPGSRRQTGTSGGISSGQHLRRNRLRQCGMRRGPRHELSAWSRLPRPPR